MNFPIVALGKEHGTARVERAVKDIRAGKMVIVSDDEDRECEGDFLIAAARVGAQDVNLLAREGRGLICCAIDTATAERLDLRILVDDRRPALHGTAFTESVDAAENTTTGISAADRAATLRALADPACRPVSLARPGHIFPIVARPGGVLERGGHTEAAVDLCRFAGLPPAGVICEIMKADGSMASGESLKAVARSLGLPLVSVADIVRYRRSRERLVSPLTSAPLPTRWGTFTIHHVASPFGQTTQGVILLTRGKALEQPRWTDDDPKTDGEALLVRVHSECRTGDLFGSLRCDCGEQLEESMRLIGAAEEGAIIYLHQEGRGIGLDAKLRAYVLQDQGLDTVEANLRLGFPPDMRDYWEAAQALRLLGRTRVRLLTNNPDKVAGLEGYGIEVAKRIPLRIPTNSHNLRYTETKRDRLGHAI
ncbi:MAG: 3,4-dihydroxy-2-butanone-4-phosphate synthase [Rectinemataceae bacterium]|jgi:3,4-dihydroxy 2-butanone 4-phosphate synthase/GTP cyclohydrolase II